MFTCSNTLSLHKITMLLNESAITEANNTNKQLTNVVKGKFCYLFLLSSRMSNNNLFVDNCVLFIKVDMLCRVLFVNNEIISKFPLELYK